MALDPVDLPTPDSNGEPPPAPAPGEPEIPNGMTTFPGAVAAGRPPQGPRAGSSDCGEDAAAPSLAGPATAPVSTIKWGEPMFIDQPSDAPYSTTINVGGEVL